MGSFKNAYELLNIRAIEFLHVNEIQIFQYTKGHDFYTALKL